MPINPSLFLLIVTSKDPWACHVSGFPPNPPPRNTQAFVTISKQDKLIDHLPLAWPENFNNIPFPMPCAKTDTHPREYPAVGGGGVDPIAVILWRRPSNPDGGDESGLEANEVGRMVKRRRREVERRERKTRKLTDKNNAAKRG